MCLVRVSPPHHGLALYSLHCSIWQVRSNSLLTQIFRHYTNVSTIMHITMQYITQITYIYIYITPAPLMYLTILLYLPIILYVSRYLHLYFLPYFFLILYFPLLLDLSFLLNLSFLPGIVAGPLDQALWVAHSHYNRIVDECSWIFQQLILF